MTLPLLELEPGCTYKEVNSTYSYDTPADMLLAVQEALQEYPKAEVSVVDDFPNSRFGYEVCEMLGGNLHWWKFWIKVADFSRCINSPNAPAEWATLGTLAGRLDLIPKLRRPALERTPDGKD